MTHSQPDQTSDLVAYQAYPQLAAALRARIGPILKLWEEASRNILPHADALTLVDFLDDVPLTLKRMADALESSRPRGLYDLEDTARVHGTSRFDQNFNMRDLITEFRLLRRIILEQVNEELKGHLAFGEVVELSMATDAAFQEALLTFVDHQRDRLRAATDAEAKFLTFLSHDLRNHLNHVTLTLEMVGANLGRSPEFAEDAADLKAVQRSILETMEGMEKLLQSEGLRKGNIMPKRSKLNLRELGHNVLQQFQVRAAEKGLDLQLNIPADAELTTDRELLTLVLQNLVSNATKYSSEGAVKLDGHPLKEGEGGWMLSVIDNGPGISEGDSKRLFEAFTRGATHGQPGLGLGLAIASEAVKLLGGTLEVESEVGKGATFRVKLMA